MAERVGLSAVLKFTGDAAISGMRAAASAFGSLNAAAKSVKAGAADASRGLTQMGMVGIGATAALGKSIKEYASFSDAVAGFSSVLTKAERKDLPRFTAQAKLLGATTSFTATQAAQTQENLKRGGMNLNDVYKSMPHVLKLAQAETLNLADTALYVGGALNTYKLSADKARRVTDIFAHVSRSTASNVPLLALAFKMSGKSAKDVKVPIEHAVAALGRLHDVNVRGTQAGTVFNQFLLNMAKHVKQGAIQVGKHKAEIVRFSEGPNKGMLNLAATMINLRDKLQKIPNDFQRIQIANKLFNVRGSKGLAIVEGLNKGSEKFSKLFGKGMAETLKKGGVAADMAREKMKGLGGQFTLFSSALSGVTIAFVETFQKQFRGGLGTVTQMLGDAAAAFEKLNDPFVSLSGKNLPAVTVQGRKVNNTIVHGVRGVILGVKDVVAMFGTLKNTVLGVGKTFGLFSDKGSAGSARTTTKLLGMSIMVVGIGVALKTTTALFGGFARAGIGAAKMVGGALSPLGKAVGGIFGGLAKKFPLLGKAPGVLGKAFKGVEKLTAQPVRVVNFDEMALAGAGTSAAAQGATTAALGLRAGLNSAAGAIPFFGTALSSSVSGIAKGSGSLIGKLGKFGLAVGVAGAAGYAFGSWLDKKLGLSDKISSGIHSLLNKGAMQAKMKSNAEKVTMGTAVEMMNRWKKMAKSGKKQFKTIDVSGKVTTHKLSREAIQAKMKEFLMKQKKSGVLTDNEQMAGIFKQLQSGINDFPKAKDLKVDVHINGQKIASAVAQQKKAAKDRGATKTATRRAAKVGAGG